MSGDTTEHGKHVILPANNRLAGQRLDEFLPLVELLKEYQVNSILEIGSRCGTVLRYMAEQTQAERCVSVDLPGGPWGNNKYLDALKRNVNAIGGLLLLGDSTAPLLIEQIRNLGPFDFVFIDGDHSYEGAYRDFINYGPMGKLVAFHDIVSSNLDKKSGKIVQVPRLWADLKKGRNTKEFVAPRSTMGIGVIIQC